MADKHNAGYTVKTTKYGVTYTYISPKKKKNKTRKEIRMMPPATNNPDAKIIDPKNTPWEMKSAITRTNNIKEYPTVAESLSGYYTDKQKAAKTKPIKQLKFLNNKDRQNRNESVETNPLSLDTLESEICYEAQQLLVELRESSSIPLCAICCRKRELSNGTIETCAVYSCAAWAPKSSITNVDQIACYNMNRERYLNNPNLSPIEMWASFEHVSYEDYVKEKSATSRSDDNVQPHLTTSFSYEYQQTYLPMDPQIVAEIQIRFPSGLVITYPEPQLTYEASEPLQRVPFYSPTYLHNLAKRVYHEIFWRRFRPERLMDTNPKYQFANEASEPMQKVPFFLPPFLLLHRILERHNGELNPNEFPSENIMHTNPKPQFANEASEPMQKVPFFSLSLLQSYKVFKRHRSLNQNEFPSECLRQSTHEAFETMQNLSFYLPTFSHMIYKRRNEQNKVHFKDLMYTNSKPQIPDESSEPLQKMPFYSPTFWLFCNLFERRQRELNQNKIQSKSLIHTESNPKLVDKVSQYIQKPLPTYLWRIFDSFCGLSKVGITNNCQKQNAVAQQMPNKF